MSQFPLFTSVVSSFESFALITRVVYDNLTSLILSPYCFRNYSNYHKNKASNKININERLFFLFCFSHSKAVRVERIYSILCKYWIDVLHYYYIVAYRSILLKTKSVFAHELINKSTSLYGCVCVSDKLNTKAKTPSFVDNINETVFRNVMRDFICVCVCVCVVNECRLII